MLARESESCRQLMTAPGMLYVALKRRYSPNSHNNGRLFLSQRVAAKELNSKHTQIARWYRELQHYGFIVMQTSGCLGAEGHGKAPHWRLTELGYMHDQPTCDFAKWDGRAFKDEIKPRPKKRAALAIVVPLQNSEPRARKAAHPCARKRARLKRKPCQNWAHKGTR